MDHRLKRHVDSMSSKSIVTTDKKQAILHSALQLFVNKGFNATSTASIAKAAGVATGTLFHHFPTKNLLALVHLKLVPYDTIRVKKHIILHSANFTESVTNYRQW